MVAQQQMQKVCLGHTYAWVIRIYRGEQSTGMFDSAKNKHRMCAA